MKRRSPSPDSPFPPAAKDSAHTHSKCPTIVRFASCLKVEPSAPLGLRSIGEDETSGPVRYKYYRSTLRTTQVQRGAPGQASPDRIATIRGPFFSFPLSFRSRIAVTETQIVKKMSPPITAIFSTRSEFRDSPILWPIKAPASRDKMGKRKRMMAAWIALVGSNSTDTI